MIQQGVPFENFSQLFSILAKMSGIARSGIARCVCIALLISRENQANINTISKLRRNGLTQTNGCELTIPVGVNLLGEYIGHHMENRRQFETFEKLNSRYLKIFP